MVCELACFFPEDHVDPTVIQARAGMVEDGLPFQQKEGALTVREESHSWFPTE